MSEMTDKQAAYRASLIQRRLHEFFAKPYRRDDLPDTALIAMLPEPTSKEDASDQIDALGDALPSVSTAPTIRRYAREHREWAQPVLDRLAANEQQIHDLHQTSYMITSGTERDAATFPQLRALLGG